MESPGLRRFDSMSADEVDEIVRRYYAGEKADMLLEHFRLDLRPADLVRHFPPLKHPEKSCERCSASPMESRRRSRSTRGSPEVYCPACSHETWNAYCRCAGCAKLRMEQIQRQQLALQQKKADEERQKLLLGEKVRAYIAGCNRSEPFFVAELPLRSRVQIAALIRSGLSEEGFYINPLSQHPVSLAPTFDMGVEILRALFKQGLLHLHPGNPLPGFIIENGEVVKFYLDRMFWTVNLETIGSPFSSQHVAELCRVTMREEERNEAFDMWREISAAECYDFLIAECEKYDFEYKVGPKTVQVIDEMLCLFSASQVFALAQSAIRKSVAYYQESRVHKPQAVNSIIGNLQRYGQRAIDEKWKVSYFHRRVDPSAISDVLSHQVLGIGEQIFRTIPGRLTAPSSIARELPDADHDQSRADEIPKSDAIRLEREEPSTSEDLFS